MLSLPYGQAGQIGSIAQYIPQMHQVAYEVAKEIPVVEFSLAGIVAFSGLAAALYLLRRRRK